MITTSRTPLETRFGIGMKNWLRKTSGEFCMTSFLNHELSHLPDSTKQSVQVMRWNQWEERSVSSLLHTNTHALLKKCRLYMNNLLRQLIRLYCHLLLPTRSNKKLTIIYRQFSTTVGSLLLPFTVPRQFNISTIWTGASLKTLES
jgi:hypothetical protein